MLRIGFIGYGKRSTHLWENNLMLTGECELVAIADPNWEAIREKKKDTLSGCTFYADAEEMLKAERLDGVVLGTRCDLHTKYAVLVAKYGIPLFLEKPVSINREQLAELEAICPEMNQKVLVSFPLRVTNIVLKVKEMLESGCIGEIAQVQAFNNVDYGRCYYHEWYHDDTVTGGLFLQKATHDLDYLNFIIGQKAPKLISAMESKMVFKGDHPAGLMCRDCPDAETCPEAEYKLPEKEQIEGGNHCCFAVDTGNHDSASILMQYENGLHLVYTQNFIVRNSAGKRGARFVGLKGTLEFDFRTNTITFIDHYSNEIRMIKFPITRGHGGGDVALGKNFVQIMKGEAPSNAPLSDGILSAKMCLAAKESAETKRFIEL